MSTKNRIAALIGGALALVTAFEANSASVYEATQQVGATPALDASAPAVCTFDVATAATLKVELTDLENPAKLASVQLVVSKGPDVAARVAAAPGAAQFDAAVGSYEIHIAGRANGSPGQYSVVVSPAAGGAPIAQCSDAINIPAAADQRVIDMLADVTINDTGMQQVNLTDIAFPAGLESADLILYNKNDTSNFVTISLPATSGTINATQAGVYQLAISATAQNTGYKAGLFSVRIANAASGTVAYAKTVAVGGVLTELPLTLPAGAYTLRVTDPVFPAALASAGAAITQSGVQIAKLDATGDSPSFNLAAGLATIYSIAQPDATAGAGAYVVQVRQGAQTVMSRALPANTAIAGTALAYAFRTDVANAGNFRVSVNDFSFPAPLSQLKALVVQNGAVLGTAVKGTPSDIAAAAGPIDFVGFTTRASATAGLFRLTLGDTTGNGPTYEAVQGVGSLFRSRLVPIPTADSYDVSLADLGFTANFQQLALAVTSGNNVVGQIFGAGKFSFQATPGSYYLNLLATTAPTADYGLYSIKVETTPAPASLTLTPSSTSVASGQKVTLTWNATNVTACTASGGWTGTRTVTGSEQVGPITGPTTYTLSCNGPGGTQTKSVDIAVTSQQQSSKGGGGGALGLEGLLLGAFALLRRRRAHP